MAPPARPSPIWNLIRPALGPVFFTIWPFFRKIFTFRPFLKRFAFLDPKPWRHRSWRRGNTARRHRPRCRHRSSVETSWHPRGGGSAPQILAPSSAPRISAPSSAPWILAPSVLLLPRALFPFPSVPALFFLPSRVFSPPQVAQPSDSSYLTVKTLISSVNRQEQGILSHLLNLCVFIWCIVRIFSKFRNLGFRL